MITKEGIKICRQLAQEFDAIAALIATEYDKHGSTPWMANVEGTRLAGRLKRRSLDLSVALAELRSSTKKVQP